MLVTASLATPSVRRPAAIAVVLALVAALLSFAAPLSASAVVVGDGPGTISGTVTAADGSPLAGTSVYIGGPAIASAWTDDDGHYEASGLALGDYFVATYPGGYQQVPSQNVSLTDVSTTATANFVVVPYATGTGAISGHVTADGAPLANHSVTAYQQSSGQNVFGVTDESGFFEFTGLASGGWTVISNAGPEYQYLYPPTVQLTGSSPSAVIDLPYVSWPVGTSSITGIVTDTATGEPIAGVQVSAFGENVSRSYTTLSDENGTYVLELLPADNYYLGSFGPGYLGTYNEDAVAVAADQSVSFDFALIAANATISGHVKGPNGSPVAGINVQANSGDGNGSGALTDDNGDYVITGLGGGIEYSVSVGGAGTSYKLKEKAKTAVANGNVTVSFTLKSRTTGSIGGFVLAPSGEGYSAAVCASLYKSGKHNPIAEVTTYGSQLGDGTYSFYDLKPGTYTVQFEDCDADPLKAFDTAFLGGTTLRADATVVTIAAGEDSWGNDFTVEPRSATSTITGHVEKSNGTPLAGLVVQATDGITSSASAVTDASGNYTIAGLFADRYTVTVGGISTPYAQKQKTVTTIADGSVAANFSLKKR